MTAEKTELTISRIINASPAAVWKAWSKPEHLAKWWIPGPIECKVIKLDLRPGGGFETQMREGEGEFQPHVEACFLEVVPEQRLVWTTALTKLLRDDGIKGVTVHGFRSAFTDWSSERTRFPKEVADKALAHKLPNKVEAAYRRTDFSTSAGT